MLWSSASRRRGVLGSDEWGWSRLPVTFLWVLMSLELVLLAGVGVGGSCPTDCVCKWKGGKQNVECVNKSMRTFPPTIDPGTQVLDVSGNSFETLPPDHFMRAGLINLQKVYLSKCRLSLINSRAFRGLSNLVDLDLSHNLLREVPSTAFQDCQGLMRLDLSGNPISHIPKRAFIPLEALTTLELTHAGIEVIDHGAFEGLSSLEWLKLNGNSLKRLGGLNWLPLGLKGVWLEDNPWECDCHLVELRVWLVGRNVANSVEPRCLRPNRLANATLKELAIENFACTPQLSPTTMYQKIGEGRNVSLLCKVSSVPESTLEWLFNGQPLSNASLNLLVETTHAYPPLSLSSSPSLASSSTSTNSGSSEKKSELLILNATSEENGTFLCVARNPAGVAMANFTVRVLTKYDGEVGVEGGVIGSIPLLVSSYPNLFIIILSTVAVIGLIVVLLLLALLVCKCSRLCCGRGRRGHGSHSSSCPLDHTCQGRNGKVKGDRKGCKGSKGLEGKHNHNHLNHEGTMSSVVTVCGGKLDRHLSETSTLTTHTKSNGSVFLLSTSSEMGLGDSNPDLIEGVKRVDGDGHETSFSHFKNCSASNPPQTIYCSSSNVSTLQADPTKLVPCSQQQTQTPTSYIHSSVSSGKYATLGRPPPASTVLLEPSQFNPYPLDYGLPKGLNVATLVRRSPSYPAVSSHAGGALPLNYDLAKYPKEYISPQPHSSPLSSSYGYAPGPLIYSSTASSPHHPEFYPTYILPPGTYLTTYSGPGGEEYAVATMNGAYLDAQPQVSCSCGPILEGNEGLELLEEECGEKKRSADNNPGSEGGEAAQVPTTNTTGTSPILDHRRGFTRETSLINNSSSNGGAREGGTGSRESVSGASLTGKPPPCATSSSSNNNSSSVNTATSNPLNNSNNIGRLQRQLTTQINESPDEGYEDESAEGTEI